MNTSCTNLSAVSSLCHFLSNENTLNLNSVLNLLERQIEASDVSVYFECSRLNCGSENINRFFKYLSYFLDSPGIQNKINDEKFPVYVLERFIFYLYRECALENNCSPNMIEERLSFLSQDTILKLITDTEILKNDYEFFLHVFSLIENKYIDRLLGVRSDFRYSMTEIFLNYPEVYIQHILSRNPIIYRYVVLFLELDDRTDELAAFTGNYERVGDETEALHTLELILRKLNIDVTGDNSRDKGRRISVITSLILGTPDPIVTLDQLEREGMFSNEVEKNMIHQLVIDKSVRNSLGFVQKEINRDELLSWASMDISGNH